MKTIRTGTKRSKFTEHAIYENGLYYFPKTQRREKKENFITVCYFDKYRGKWLEDTFRTTDELAARIRGHARKAGLISTKTYYIQNGVGSSRYVVNYHDGEKTHDDGSPFFDIKIFTNLIALGVFTGMLEKIGYKRK